MIKFLKIVPDIVHDQTICSMLETNTVDEAARRMADFDIGAVVVVDEQDRLCGIITERDVTRRVVAVGREPHRMRLAEAMTRNPDTLAPDDSAFDALELMQVRKHRYLPVVDDGRVVGVVSLRDLHEAVRTELDDDVRETQALVFGDRWGA